MCESGRGRGKNRKRHKKDSEDGFEGWGGYMAAKRAKLLDQFHNENIEKVSDIFAGIKIMVNGLTHPSAAELKNLMAAHGGEFHMYQGSSTTHIIASNLPNVKIKHLGAVPVVKPAWITESIGLNKLLDYKNYLLYSNQTRTQPALNFPVVPKPSCSEEVQNKSEFNTKKYEEPSVIEPDNNFSTRITKTASDPTFLKEFYSNSRLHLISTLGAEFKQLVAQLREKFDGKFPGREKLIVENGGNSTRNVELPPSVVMHIDMDCFFVSVSLKNHPELKGKPVAVTHAKSGVIHTSDTTRQATREQEFALYQQRVPDGVTSRVVDIKDRVDGLASLSEIASCSYEARQYGIKNGMFLGQAVKLCPDLKTVPYDFEGYREVSNTLYNTVASYTLDIEAVSCDEMYVDIKPILLDAGLSIEEWATHIRQEITAATGCPCSAGFGDNRLQARLATRKAKPAGQFWLNPAHVEEYMSEIALADLPGVGRATLGKLSQLGLSTCRDVQMAPLRTLQAELGARLGEKIRDQAFGRDSKPLDFNHERKSVSAEINYGIRFKSKGECYSFLQSLSEEVFSRLSDVNMKARGLTLKLLVRAEGAPVETAKFLGHGVCDAVNKSSTSNVLYSSSDIIYREAKNVYDKLNVAFSELRGVGIQLTKLEKNVAINKGISSFLKRDFKKTGGKKELNMTTEEEKYKDLSLSKITPESAATISKPKGRGRPKGSKNNQNKSVFSNTANKKETTLSIPKFLKKNQRSSMEEPPAIKREEIDLNVLSELPEDIRKDIIREYKIEFKPNKCDNGSKATSSVSKQEKIADKISPFSKLTWDEIKPVIKKWIESESVPSSLDIEMLGDHLRRLALDGKIEILQRCFNFLHRVLGAQKCPWHEAYFSLVNVVQLGMVSRYGKTLLVQNNFVCCEIH